MTVDTDVVTLAPTTTVVVSRPTHGSTVTVDRVTDTEIVARTPTTTAVTVTRPAATSITVTETERVEVQETTAGVPGPEGLSAYHVALLDGFVGTEDDWLASLVGPTGPTGPQGATGPQGPQGLQGVRGEIGGTYQFVQGQALSTWVIVHGLGYNPNVTTVDSSGTRVEGDVQYQDISTVVVSFSVPLGGTAYLS